MFFRFLLITFVLALAAPAFANEPKSILLVARKDLPDPNFRDSVVLVLHRGRGGPVGVIINRPTDVQLSQVFADVDALRASQEKLYFGGPVSRAQLNFVFRASSAPEDAVELLDGVYLGSGRELLRTLLARDNPFDGLRVFAGYAGWAPGQLEAEIARGDWHLARAEAKTLFDRKPEGLWRELERRAGATMVRLESERPR